MSEKPIDANEESNGQKRNFTRRKYLKLAGVAGSGLGTGIGASAMGSELVTPVKAAPSVIEDFNCDSSVDECSPLSDYNGETSNDYYEIVTDTLEGGDSTNTLKATGSYGDLGNTNVNTPRGNEYRVKFKVGNNTVNPGLLTCVQNTSAAVDDCYWAQVNQKYGKLKIYLREGGSGTNSASTSLPTLSTGTVYELAVELDSDAVRTTIYDNNGNSVTETASISDSTYSGGQLGFYTGGEGSSAYYDYVTKESLGDGNYTPEYVLTDDFEPPNDLDSYYRFNTGRSNAQPVTDDEAAYSGSNPLAPVFSGEKVLEHTGGDVEMFSLPGDGLENYPSPGDRFGAWIMSEGGTGDTYLAYGVQDSFEDYFFVNVDFTNGYLILLNHLVVIRHRSMVTTKSRLNRIRGTG